MKQSRDRQGAQSPRRLTERREGEAEEKEGADHVFLSPCPQANASAWLPTAVQARPQPLLITMISTEQAAAFYDSPNQKNN